MFRIWKPKTRRSLSPSAPGQSLIEVALVLPALLLLLLGVLDIGRAFMSLVILNDAVSEGAAYAATNPTKTTEIKERAADSCTALLLSPDMFRVDYVDPPRVGEPITVTVTYDFMLVNPIINAIVPSGTLTLRASEASVIYTEWRYRP